jgi:hypothetical protein
MERVSRRTEKKREEEEERIRIPSQRDQATSESGYGARRGKFDNRVKYSQRSDDGFAGNTEFGFPFPSVLAST